MSANTLYQVFDRALPAEVCEIVRAAGNALAHADGALYMGKEYKVESSRRKTRIGFWSRESWVNGLLSHYVALANRAWWSLDLVLSQGVQFGIYGEDSHYDWHKDDYNVSIESADYPEWRGLNRKLSVCAALNEGTEYEGGNFEIKDPWGAVVPIPLMRHRGSVVVLPSSVVHRVSRVEAGTRYSIVSWYLGPPLR